jgi:hypothetical protein
MLIFLFENSCFYLLKLLISILLKQTIPLNVIEIYKFKYTFIYVVIKTPTKILVHQPKFKEKWMLIYLFENSCFNLLKLLISILLKQTIHLNVINNYKFNHMFTHVIIKISRNILVHQPKFKEKETLIL